MALADQYIPEGSAAGFPLPGSNPLPFGKPTARLLFAYPCTNVGGLSRPTDVSPGPGAVTLYPDVLHNTEDCQDVKPTGSISGFLL